MANPPRHTLTIILSCAFAIAVAGLVLLGLHAFRLQAANALLHQQMQLAELEVRSREVQFASEQILTQAELRAATALDSLQLRFLHPQENISTRATIAVLWHPDRHTGMISALHLPPLAEGTTYSLWAITADDAQRAAVGSFQAQQATEHSPFVFTIPSDFFPDARQARFGLSVEAVGEREPKGVLLFSSE